MHENEPTTLYIHRYLSLTMPYGKRDETRRDVAETRRDEMSFSFSEITSPRHTTQSWNINIAHTPTYLTRIMHDAIVSCQTTENDEPKLRCTTQTNNMHFTDMISFKYSTRSNMICMHNFLSTKKTK